MQKVFCDAIFANTIGKKVAEPCGKEWRTPGGVGRDAFYTWPSQISQGHEVLIRRMRGPSTLTSSILLYTSC